MAQAQMVRVENRRPTFIELPKLEVEIEGGHKAHVMPRLRPGGNNVPKIYMDAIEKLSTAKGPGKVWASLKTHRWVRVMTPSESKEAVKQPEGPEAPETLAEYKAEGALELISRETSAEVLGRWKSDRRREVKRAIDARLAVLGGYKPDHEDDTET